MARQDRTLAELSELGLELARGLQVWALAAETAGEAQALSLAFHRTSRSVRQTIALEAKLDRDRRGQDRDDRRAAEQRDGARTVRRRQQLRLAVERAIWTEVEGDVAEHLVDHLDDLLEEDALDDGFLEGPVEAQIARLRADLGLPAEAPTDVTLPPALDDPATPVRGDPGEGHWTPTVDPVPRAAGFNSS